MTATIAAVLLLLGALALLVRRKIRKPAPVRQSMARRVKRVETQLSRSAAALALDTPGNGVPVRLGPRERRRATEPLGMPTGGER